MVWSKWDGKPCRYRKVNYVCSRHISRWKRSKTSSFTEFDFVLWMKPLFQVCLKFQIMSFKWVLNRNHHRIHQSHMTKQTILFHRSKDTRFMGKFSCYIPFEICLTVWVYVCFETVLKAGNCISRSIWIRMLPDIWNSSPVLFQWDGCIPGSFP